jgi:hypothetical protein
LPREYRIPDAARANRGDTLAAKLAQARGQGAFPELPFGSDLTAEEVELARALKWLKLPTATWRGRLVIAVRRSRRIRSAPARAALERMELANAAGLRQHRAPARRGALRASKPA